MKHKASSRIVPNAKTAVLFLHGIAGSPNHFRSLLPLEELVSEEFSFYNILLPGHGGTVKDFGRSSMKQWKEHVWSVFNQLSQTHEKVILVGHSMGTLFSIHLALQYPQKVAALLLIEVPFRVGLKWFGVKNLVRRSFGKLNFDDPIQQATLDVSSIAPSAKIWQYICWIPRLLELIRLMHQTAKVVGDLQQKVIAYQSPIDELVSSRSARILERSGRVEVCYFDRSTHFYYHPEEIKQVQESLYSLLSQYSAK